MTRNYEDVAAKFWNLPSKGEEESRRETLFMDGIIQKAHLDREIESVLPGVKTVLDAGAGSGRFSIPLAKRGLDVTHLDISQPMLTKARELAEAAGVPRTVATMATRMLRLTTQIRRLSGIPNPLLSCYPVGRRVLPVRRVFWPMD